MTCPPRGAVPVNSQGDITRWQRQADSSTPTGYALSYDGADQLSEALLTQSGSTVHRYVENYDLSGNRTSEQIDLGVNSASYNNLNQLISRSGGGPLRLSGTVNQPSSVTVNGSAATSVPATSFSSEVGTSTGTNVFTVIAQDASGLTATNRYQVVVPPPGSGNNPTYDPNGNLLSDGTRTYEWDAANRLTAINYGAIRSEFSYDPLGRRSKIVEKNNGSVTATRQFVWAGGILSEERDASNTVQKRFFGMGEQIGGTSYFHTRDHLGSIREMLGTSGAIQARYDYDPYGRTTLVSGTNLSDFQYAGYYEHQPSGLNLTTFRAYDPNSARWLARDPLGEDGGINLYSYADNDPIDGIDPWGLFSVIASEFGGPGDANHNGYGPFNAGNDYKGPMVDPNKPGASLPAKLPPDQRMVKITNPANGKSVVAPLVDKGPHNTNNPYWNHCNKNDGRPMAESQYANKTKDQLGRVPTNPAGIDLTPATMNALGVPGSPGTRQAPVNWDFVK